MSFIINPYSVQTPLLLDIYTDAAMAYSIRKLRTDYTGSAIRVRRSSDNTEQDIGFDANGNLDESALTTFVGAGSGFIRTWYDQTGNGRDATQTTTGSQPRIVNAGTIDKVNSKPAIYFFTGAANYNLVPSNATGVFNAKTYGEIYAVVRSSIASGLNKYIIWFGISTTNSALARYGLLDGNTADRFASIGRGSSDAATAVLATHGTNHGTANQYLLTSFTSWASGGTIGIRQNAAGQVTAAFGGTGTSPATNSNAVRIGTNSSTGYWGGYIQELIVFNTDQSSNRSSIETSINSHFTIY